jgi:transposase
VVDEVVADRSYDSDAIRCGLLDEGVMPQVPNHPRRTDPWPLYTPSYRERNRAERLVGRLKQYRRVATRYDKLAATFLGFVHLALTVIRLTCFVNTT